MERHADLIYDIGMHVAQDTEFYLKKGFRVVAIEANPMLCKQARERFHMDIDDGRLVIIEGCVAHEAGEMDFYVNKEVAEWSSAKEALGSRQFGSEKIRVRAVTVPEIMGEYGVPYYMKIDIEGADVIPVQGLAKTQARPVYVSFEASSFGPAAILYTVGYKRFAVVSQRAIPECVLPNPPKEGRYTEHAFALGASGPFGKEVPAEWGTIDDCVREHVAYHHTYRNVRGKKDDWFDIHAYSARAAREFGLE